MNYDDKDNGQRIYSLLLLTSRSFSRAFGRRDKKKIVCFFQLFPVLSFLSNQHTIKHNPILPYHVARGTCTIVIDVNK